LLFLPLLVGAGSRRSTPRQPKIDTVVVLMLENRSFDHMLGLDDFTDLAADENTASAQC
jgi:phospholipase C